MAYLPTVEFGPGMTSATEIRSAWPQLNNQRKTALVMSLYPATQSNPALAANVVKMLDTAMGSQVDEDLSRRGFLRGLGAAAVAGAPGSAMAQSQPVDVSQAFANMRKDDPRVQHNKDIDEMARAIYDQMVTLRGQPIDRRQQQMWMTIAREKAAEKLSKYAPGRPAAQSQSSGFPSQGSERRVSKNIDNFESQGVAGGSQEINWVKPNFDFEWHEVEEQSRMKQVPVDVRQYYQKHFPNKDAWLKAVQNGKAVVVPPDHAYEIRNAPFDKESLQKVLAPTGHEGPIGPAKEKRVNDLFDKGQVEMPIILKTSQGLWLIGGKTRLGTANYVKGLPAKVWLISGEQGVAEGLEFFSMPLRMSEYRGKTHPATNQPYDAKFKFSGDLKDRVHDLLNHLRT
jgi:hypothetical protein